MVIGGTATLAHYAWAATADATPAALSHADLQFFEAKVRPVLVDQCYKCHSKEADKVRGGFMLDSREALLHGGDSGSAIEPGRPEDSLLVQAIGYEDEDLQMPPKGKKLSAQQIADLTEWVRRGAPDPRTLVAKGSSSSYGGVGREHWAFQPVVRPTVPEVRETSWVRNSVDRFVLAKLETSGMVPNDPADKATLLRRVYFDLVGLPPPLREVQDFLNDSSPDAFAKIVDRLLDSPRYGERWGRHWLDVARYSDTKGDPRRQEDVRYPHAWTYRDWVIAAFNADLPYNEFIIQQLAGDRVQAVLDKQAKSQGQPDDGNRSPLAALGFLTLGNQFDGRRDDIIGDQIDVTTKAFLGLTVACARCHDHKFDPIPTKDYYSLYGVFANSVQPAKLPTLKASPPETDELRDYLAKAAEIEKRATDLAKERQAFRRTSRRKGGKRMGMAATNPVDPQKRRELVRTERTLQREAGNLESSHPGAPPRVNALFDVPRPRDYPVLIRGEAGNRGEVVPRRFLEILSPDSKKRPTWPRGSGRVELALAIADPANPLTARVLVNRVWQHHFGQGFVATPDDLGNMSSPPTHPELLDWLASEFVEGGWSIKNLHRTILLSAAYQQSSRTNDKFAALDPDNKLLWRYNLRRLGFEELHDSLLAIAGELDITPGGRPVAIASGDFARRRAVYMLVDRRSPSELLTQFDFPSPDVPSGIRYETTVPQQALFLMNSPMVVETARKLVKHPGFGAIKTDEDRVTTLYLAVYQRMPTRDEIVLGLGYVKANPGGTAIMAEAKPAPTPKNVRRARFAARRAAASKRKQGKFSTQVGGTYDTRVPPDAWTKLAHALFQSNEAMYYR